MILWGFIRAKVVDEFDMRRTQMLKAKNKIRLPKSQSFLVNAWAGERGQTHDFLIM